MTTTMTDLQSGRTFVFNEALPGRDAYEDALALGFTGSRAAWLAHLRGFAFDPASADWEVDRSYAANAAVRHQHKIWVAVVANVGVTPGSDPAIWQLLLDGSSAQSLTDAVAAALAHKGAAEAAATDAEAKRAAAALILAQTQLAAQALSPIDALHPVAFPIPAGWWDTGDRLLSGTATRALISNWQHAMLVPGALWRGTLGASVHAANTGDVDASIGGPVGEIEDQSGNARHLTQASASLRPTFGRRPRTGLRNRLSSGTHSPSLSNATYGSSADSPAGAGTARLLSASAAGSASALWGAAGLAGGHMPSIYVKAAASNFLRFGVYITGVAWGLLATVNLATGASSSPAMVVTNAGGGWWRLTAAAPIILTTGATIYAYLASDATGTSPVGGESVWVAAPQIEVGLAATAPQIVATPPFDVTEAGVETVTYADFDLVDDTLATGAIAGGLTGQAFVAGDGGCFASTLSIAAGGTFSIGGTFHDWTGAAPGILRAVTGDTGRMLDAVIRAGTFTEAEIAALERFYRARGGKGLLVADGIERVVNGGFATDTDWTKGTGWTIAGGMATKAAGTGADLSQAAGLVPGAFYRITLSVVAVRAQSLIYVLDGNPQAYFDLTRNNPANLVPGTLTGVFRAPNSGQVVLRLGGSASADIDNVSVQRLIPREEL